MNMRKSGGRKMLNKGLIIIFILPFLVALFSCERDAPKITKGMKKNFPNRSLIDANIIFKDSGAVTMNLRSPLIKNYICID